MLVHPNCLFNKCNIHIISNNIASANFRPHLLLSEWCEDFDIFIFQEIWWDKIGTGQSDSNPLGKDVLGTMNNPQWVTYLPPGRDARVAIYVSKHFIYKHNLTITPIPIHVPTGHMMGIRISQGDAAVTIISIYNSAKAGRDFICEVVTVHNIDPQHKYLIAGDFNLHHPLWDSQVPANHVRGDARLLADWFLNNNIHIDNDPDTPTRRGQPGQHDTVIDLIGLSTNGIYDGTFDPIAVRPDLNTGSDHYPITTTIHLLQLDASPHSPTHSAASSGKQNKNGPPTPSLLWNRPKHLLFLFH
ncbi:hypothetical protein H0H81_005052 [Sphagnurus paluster]|uniref:Endonuclease/exonuclease/phosphatase domain-containing protein n=1 Tax=Sphagnurus paluster TaxID=117069 RepID=A0A9P7K266_9AGAR|nr:hypothetical protein H0H81_005052 [Sphagnurus paluster]